MKLQYQQLNPHSNALGRALERWSVRSPSLQYLMQAYYESSRKYGLTPAELVRLDDKRNPKHQAWLSQNPKNVEWVTNRSKDKQPFFLKWLIKPLVNNIIIPIAISLALAKRSFSAKDDRDAETSSKVSGTNKAHQPSIDQTQTTNRARRIEEMNRVEITKQTNRIKKTTEIKRGNKKIENRDAAAALSPVSSIKAPGIIYSPRPQKSKEEENARIASRKPLSTRPKDPTDPY